MVDNLFLAPNTLTQRMSGPKMQRCGSYGCLEDERRVMLRASAAFNGLSGVLAVVMENGKESSRVMSHQSVSLSDRGKKG